MDALSIGLPFLLASSWSAARAAPGPKVTQNFYLGPRGAFKEASGRQKEDKQQARALGQLGNE